MCLLWPFWQLMVLAQFYCYFQGRSPSRARLCRSCLMTLSTCNVWYQTLFLLIVQCCCLESKKNVFLLLPIFTFESKKFIYNSKLREFYRQNWGLHPIHQQNRILRGTRGTRFKPSPGFWYAVFQTSKKDSSLLLLFFIVQIAAQTFTKIK